MALEVAGVQLAAGGDVLVPQFLGRLDFVLQLERLSQRTGAEFVELALLSDPNQAGRRFIDLNHSGPDSRLEARCG